MQISRLLFSVLMKIIIFFISCSIFLSSEANQNESFGFSTELIHRDSSLSPFSDPNLSNIQRQDIAFKRILQRYKTQKLGSSVLIFDNLSYLMKIVYGNPPHEFFQEITTATDISWIQCEPCDQCFASEYSPYPPNVSHTFVYEKCLGMKNNRCPYNKKYADKSYSHGELARETIRVGSGQHTVRIDNFIFGCGYKNVGQFSPKSAGVLGLNPKELSFITQLRSKHHGKFAYCMAPLTAPNPGKIRFGSEAVVSGHGVMKTPIIFDSNYYVMLESISVGIKKVKYFSNQYSSSLFSSSNYSRTNWGKMLIDTGTNTMILPPPFQKQIEALVRDHIKAKPIAPPPGPFTLCYHRSLQEHEIPNITVHFRGVELFLTPLHTFIVTNYGDRCLAITAEEDLPLLGNMAQVNFLVGFDLIQKTLAFKPTDCSSLNA